MSSAHPVTSVPQDPKRLNRRALAAQGLALLFIALSFAWAWSDMPAYFRSAQRYFRLSATPGYGESFVLPAPVLTAIRGLREMNATTYHLHGMFATDQLLSQRMAEGAWPIRIQSDSPLVAAFCKDLEAEQWNVLKRSREVCLAVPSH